MNHLKKILLILLFVSKSLFSQEISKDSIRKSIDKSLQFLAENQTKETIFGKQYAGEWEGFMEMKGFFFLLGLKSSFRDSNCFTMAGIHNILAEMYVSDTTRKEILPMLKKVFPEVMTYASGNAQKGYQFNFWKMLPPTRDLRWGKEPNPVPWGRRPTNFTMDDRFIHNAANVENDADDTSMGNLAIWYHEKIFGKTDSLNLLKTNTFDRFLDKNRENRNWYNFLFHGFPNSGAYLTWLAQEAEYENWNFLKTLGQNLFFYLPRSICFPHPYKPYIPWGTNDVDVVVNANVLTYLAKTNQIEKSKGSKNAHLFIEKHAKRGRWGKMGVYYPNRYHFHFAVSRALVASDSALLSVAPILLSHLKKTQHENGSFETNRRVNKHDILQSSAYALMSMMYLKQAGVDIPKSMVDKTIAFIESQKINQNHWKGGVFFSGGTIVRSILFFKSDAYTTALIASAYQKYLQFY